TVEQVAFDGLAESGGAARAVGFPARREDQRTADWKVRPHGCRPPPLEPDDVRFGGVLDAYSLAIDGLEMIHEASGATLEVCSTRLSRVSTGVSIHNARRSTPFQAEDVEQGPDTALHTFNAIDARCLAARADGRRHGRCFLAGRREPV